MLYRHGVGRDRDLGQRRSGRARRRRWSTRSGTSGAVSRALHAARIGRPDRRPRAVRHQLGPGNRHVAATWSSSPAASAWRRCGRCCSAPWPGAQAYGRGSCSIAGARSPAEFLFRGQLAGLGRHAGLWKWGCTVDAAGDQAGRVGRVRDRAAGPAARSTRTDDRLRVRARAHDALLRRTSCWARALAARASGISLERNMQCGIGLCGHCQLGPLLVCRDGPVVGYGTARAAARHREL